MKLLDLNYPECRNYTRPGAITLKRFLDPKLSSVLKHAVCFQVTNAAIRNSCQVKRDNLCNPIYSIKVMFK